MNSSLFRRLAVALACFLSLAVVPTEAADDDVAGQVVRLQGAAVAMQDAVPRPLKNGDKILRGDVISTGKGARIEMKMVDDAIMTLGEKTVFVVIDYIASGPKPTASLRLLEGAFAAASGKIPQLAGASMKIETETSTIGIRGTTFWGGKLDGDFQIALLSKGSITVENRAGRVVIDKQGEGTLIKDQNTVPTKPTPWGDEKVARASKTVAFN
jgi:hypothetical protein